MRPVLVLVASSLTVGACAAGATGSAVRTPGEGPVATAVEEYPDAQARFLDRMMNEPRPVERSAMPPRHLDEEQFPRSLVDRTRIVWGGVAPDAIASIDEPTFERADTVDWIEDQEAVMVLQVDGAARGYPVQVMIWHEIVNDRIGDRPVTVTYCPLCDSAVAFDRRVGDRVLDFGTSGSLHRSALVMYDRQTESLWTQFDGVSVVGTLVGERLEALTVSTVGWSDFLADHPTAPVLSRETGYDRPYGTNRYGSLDSRDRPLSGWFTEEVDDRFAAYDRVVGIDRIGGPVAVTHALVAASGVVSVDIGDRPVEVWHQPGTASPVDDPEVAAGRDVGATGVFFTDVDGSVLSFRRTPDGFVDDQSGSTWNVLGEAVAGPRAGQMLDPVPHLNTFWFAWSTAHPDGAVLG